MQWRWDQFRFYIRLNATGDPLNEADGPNCLSMDHTAVVFVLGLLMLSCAFLVLICERIVVAKRDRVMTFSSSARASRISIGTSSRTCSPAPAIGKSSICTKKISDKAGKRSPPKYNSI